MVWWSMSLSGLNGSYLFPDIWKRWRSLPLHNFRWGVTFLISFFFFFNKTEPFQFWPVPILWNTEDLIRKTHMFLQNFLSGFNKMETLPICQVTEGLREHRFLTNGLVEKIFSNGSYAPLVTIFCGPSSKARCMQQSLLTCHSLRKTSARPAGRSE